MKSINLVVILGLRCNFNCSHCINESSPKATLAITNKELNLIADEVNSNPSIKSLEFSGGEPTLFSKEIILIQSKITRKIKYGITTNASLNLLSLKEFLKKIHIDHAAVSFDNFHLPFINQDKVIKFIEVLKKHNIKVWGNSVVQKHSDLIKMDQFFNACDDYAFTKLIKGGRQKESSEVYDLKSWDKVCPSFSDLKNNRIKIIYIPKKGFSFCCGPLAFDNLNDEVFYDKIDNILTDSNVDKFKIPFIESIKNTNYKPEKCSSKCETCVKIFSKNKSSSLYDLHEKKDASGFYPISDNHSSNFLESFQSKYHTSYFLTVENGCLNTSKQNFQGLEDLKIKFKNFSNENDVFRNFTIENFYNTHKNYYSEKDIEEFEKAIPDYMKSDPKGYVYYKDNKAVALITTFHYINHPADGNNYIHIGYWGYKKEYLKIHESIAIKEHWKEHLRTEMGANHNLDVHINIFNKPSLKLANEIGFSKKMVILKKRHSEI